MAGSAYGFDWDSANTKKCEKHGVSIADIELLFMHEPGVYPDSKHSDVEERHLAIGINDAGRHIAVVFTYRERDGTTIIRPISARYMHKKEINRYTKDL
ncbi:MAG: BrnT family toxin [Minisyncoccia bacterium]